MQLKLYAPVPRGIPPLLVQELRDLGAQDLRELVAGVSFSGDLACAYRACLWSRTASRVLAVLAEGRAETPGELYDIAVEIPWEEHFRPAATFAVACTGRGSGVDNTHFGALKVKDAVVDRLRDRRGQRPSVDTRNPDLRLHLHLASGRVTLTLDLSGDALHRRGYRVREVVAPLKENLAAALLIRAGWPAICRDGGALLDPLCGSGTLLIEGAWIAADHAPGMHRESWGFEGWTGHDAELWGELVAEARTRAEQGLRHLPRIIGYDADASAVRSALANLEHAGLHGRVHVERRELADCRPPTNARGLVVANPPYGERLGEAGQLGPLYQRLGEVLGERFTGWEAGIFTGNPELAQRMGIRAHHSHRLYNGAIECRLLRFTLTPDSSRREPRPQGAVPEPVTVRSQGATMFANRLRKNLRELGRWAGREGISCYRLYDADMPEYAIAVDLYHGDRLWVHVQEYQAPRTIDPEKAASRRDEALAVLPEALDVPTDQVFFKTRQRQRGRTQYERFDGRGRFEEANEGGAVFLVNFTDYLDTGLFLDHRITRGILRAWAHQKHFLNLFCYTGTATVQAALGGARSTTSVDMSATYLDWAGRNLARNGFSESRHRLVQAECFAWLEAESTARQAKRYGLIFLDPPTFSTSKRMEGTLDAQRDHVLLIRQAVDLLEPGGKLVFSTNFRRFRLDYESLADLDVEDISGRTIPRDFARNPRIHQCFRIEHRGASRRPA